MMLPRKIIRVYEFFYFFLLPLEQNQLKLTDIRKDDLQMGWF